MIVSERLGKWFINAYPPFIFNRIRIQYFGKDYRSCRVRIKRSLLNRNMNGTIFGGSLFSASDPFYAILYWQIFERKGLKVQTWLKSAHIQYLRPADRTLFLDFKISDEELAMAESSLKEHGKFKHNHRVQYLSKEGEVFVVSETEVYIRLVKDKQKEVLGF